MKKMNKKGFTLIELLAVILILGIIALIAIPTVNTVIMEARIGAWKATANQVIKSYQQYGQLCDMRPACEKLTSFKASGDEGYEEDVNDLKGSTVKKELEINGDMPNSFDSLGLTKFIPQLGIASIALGVLSGAITALERRKEKAIEIIEEHKVEILKKAKDALFKVVTDVYNSKINRHS